MITIDNYFSGTIATFKGCKTPKREPDYISYMKSFYSTDIVSSRYWYGEDKNGKYVIRESDHWCTYKKFDNKKRYPFTKNIASCYWRLKTNNKNAVVWLAAKHYVRTFGKYITYPVSGKCYIKDFIPVSPETDWKNAFRKGLNYVMN